jgi:hypothetical protein
VNSLRVDAGSMVRSEATENNVSPRVRDVTITPQSPLRVLVFIVASRAEASSATERGCVSSGRATVRVSVRGFLAVRRVLPLERCCGAAATATAGVAIGTTGQARTRLRHDASRRRPVMRVGFSFMTQFKGNSHSSNLEEDPSLVHPGKDTQPREDKQHGKGQRCRLWREPWQQRLAVDELHE